MIRKRRSLRRQQPGLTVLRISNSLSGQVFCTKQSYLHLWLVPLLASSNGYFRCSFHFSFPKMIINFIISMFPTAFMFMDGFWFQMFHGISWDFRLFRFECFRPPMAWCSSWPRRASRRHKWSWANGAGPRLAKPNREPFWKRLVFDVFGVLYQLFVLWRVIIYGLLSRYLVDFSMTWILDVIYLRPKDA